MLTEEAPSKVIEDYIKRMAKESEKNRLHLTNDSTIFDEPLVGFASGDDPLFSQYRTIIGEFHMTPREFLEKATGKGSEKVSVIAYVLPYTESSKATMRREKHYPTERWAQADYYGIGFNDFLRTQLVDFLQTKGYAAVAPYVSPFFRRLVTPTDRTSNWSERHILYACGLGTFGLSDGLITPRGMAMRCGSVVTDLELPATPRTYDSHTANCPFLVNGSCGKCIDRCPAGAITAKGHDKIRCAEYRSGDTIAALRERYGLKSVACGFCQIGVPCESAIPEGLLKRTS